MKAFSQMRKMLVCEEDPIVGKKRIGRRKGSEPVSEQCILFGK